MKIAINGFGRIGRCALKSAIKYNLDVDFVAINDLTDTKTLAHLFKYDSAYGVFDGLVEAKENSIVINGKEIKVFAKKDPEELPWEELGVDVALECTGIFRDEAGAGKHIKAGAKKVIISAPAKEDTIPSYIMGINEKEYKGESIIDMGSCTTNCLAPVVKILEDEFGIEKGFMTTIHSYTNDQNILDLPHKDLRRARSAAENIIPTTTGAAKAIGKVIPNVKGKMDGIAVRVPTPVVSLVDLTCELRKEVTLEEVNNIMLKYSDKEGMKGIFYVESSPLVSSDFIGNSFSSIFDNEYTKADGKLVKVLAWYDNEWAYALRMVELAKIIG